jgi:hypothetical protein
MQAFKNELFKRVREIEKKENREKLIKKISVYGGVYGSEA